MTHEDDWASQVQREWSASNRGTPDAQPEAMVSVFPEAFKTSFFWYHGLPEAEEKELRGDEALYSVARWTKARKAMNDLRDSPAKNSTQLPHNFWLGDIDLKVQDQAMWEANTS